jgi:UDP-glucose 4-epimerase
MILLTGGLGFLGCNLAYLLAEQGQKVLLTQHRVSRIPAFLEPWINNGIQIASCDIMNLANLFHILKRFPINSIIHSAVLSSPKFDLYRVLQVNINGTINILEASRIMEIKSVTFLSSQSVYQRSHEKIHTEDEDLPIESPHYISLTKKPCEMVCDYYAKEYKLRIVTLRPAQIWGPLYASGRFPLQKMAENAVADRPTHLPEVNPFDGNNLIYIKDCAKAIGMVHLAENPQFTLYNLGDRYVAYGEMAEVIKEVVPEAVIKLGPGNEKEAEAPMHLNMERLQSEFGFKPEYSFKDGIQDYVQWLREGVY